MTHTTACGNTYSNEDWKEIQAGYAVDIAKILKERRLSLNISQNELADYCGLVGRANISRFETGKIEWKWRDALKACEALGLKIEIQEANVDDPHPPPR